MAAITMSYLLLRHLWVWAANVFTGVCKGADAPVTVKIDDLIFKKENDERKEFHLLMTSLLSLTGKSSSMMSWIKSRRK